MLEPRPAGSAIVATVARVAIGAVLCCAAGPAHADWPGFLGPGGNLGVDPREGPRADSAFGLRVRWTRPLGPGYSGIAVAGEWLYTLASAGDEDFLVALAAGDGAERWRKSIGPRFPGRQGSRDGPLSTPAVTGDAVVVLSPHGVLWGFDRTRGEVRFRVDLTETLRAAPAVYGFASSPLIVSGPDERIVLQPGGQPAAAVAAFDLGSGRHLWSAVEDTVEYQSAALMELAGRRQLVAVTATRIAGLDPATGSVLWTVSYLDRPQDAGPYPISLGPDRFLVNGRRSALAYEIADEDGSLVPRQVWESRELKQSYAIPIHHRGHVYGYSGEFLTAIDAATGRRDWKSRPPGKGALLRVNDMLFVWTIDGELVAVEATPAGYRERARLPVLPLGSITNPSYSNRRIYVRSHESIAAVDVTREPPEVVVDATAQPDVPPGRFRRFLAELEAAPDKARRIDAFIESQSGFPIVEDDGVVHLVYRGPARDVAAFLGNVSRRGADPLQQVAGTDLWYRSYRLPPGGRYDYRFELNFDRQIPDPLNPRRAPSPGEFSELALPGWDAADPDAAQGAEPPRGTLTDVRFMSRGLGNRRKLQVWLPPGYAGGRTRHPLLLVVGGPDALEFGRMDRILDRAVAAGKVEPPVVVFVGYEGGRAWRETGGPRGERFAWMLAEELPAFLERRYRLDPGRDRRAVMGADLGGYAALLATLAHPDAFGKVATQSLYSHNREVTDGLVARIPTARPGAPIAAYLDWCLLEPADPGEGTDLRRDNARLAEALESAGHDVESHELAAGPGWGTWRARTAAILERLFPARQAPTR